MLVDCPGTQDLFIYRVPEGMRVEPGDILSVPFGGQQVGALAIRWAELPVGLDAAAVRLVDEVVSQQFFPAGYWLLLQRIAEYYCTPLMQVVRMALPPGLLGRSQRRIRLKREALPEIPVALHPAAQSMLQRLQAQKSGSYSWQFLSRQVRGARQGLQELLSRGWVESVMEPPTPVRPKQRQAVTWVSDASLTPLSSRQREVLDVLRRRGGELWLQELLQLCQTSSSVVKGLAQKGCVVIQPREMLRMETGAVTPDRPKPLTPDQAQTVAAIARLNGYHSVLLHGVTGSGKTEVYLQAIAPVLQQGQSALVLVPEIGLTPQLTDRFRARFGDKVQVYHSALSEGERYDTWRQMFSGAPQVIIGTRSAVFAPLPHVGLIVLDEEHDSSFKQDRPAPCYHARTVAQWRAEWANCPLILGSATPSLESWVAATEASHSLPEPESRPSLYLSLPERIQARPLPPIELIDMRHELLQGNRSIFSRTLQDALRQLQDTRQQGILFIPRRGHSTFVSCRSCGYVLLCPHCDISLTYHQVQEGGPAVLRCHYCGHAQAQPPQCPTCQSPYLKHFGSGTQRVMQELAHELPDLRCLRFDSDTTRTKGAHRALLNRFAQGEADLLVGTQMLTKGIDLPQVTLVSIVAADGLLHLPDYRASERAFQVMVQVAGRAGRGAEPGRVILQTYSPEHAVIQAVLQHAYEPFATAELAHRAGLGYPPYGRLVLLRLSGLEASAVQQAAETLADRLRAMAGEWEVLGPAPAAVMRVARRFHWQILLKAPLQNVAWPNLADLRSHCPTPVSLTIDVDPLNLL